ncbi:MAG: hypothetical protein H6766_06400 [Candidatus Peribacteria bacterium]|nr:MAG: hypothetical protein H6766_06400 [Candidatus Peribacteria bacterium]
MMRKYIFGGIIALATMSSGVTWAAATSFIVTITPDTFVEGEAVDVEIRAVDAQGNVSTDFASDIFLGIDEV